MQVFSNICKYSIIFIFLWIISFKSAAQQRRHNYGIQRITTEIQQSQPGISQNSIRCIFKDHKGLLWLGTWDGLNRYDGIRFMIIRMEVGNKKASLTNSTINAINQDKNHQLWVGTDGGINCFDYQSMNRVQLDLKQNIPLSTDTIHAVHIDSHDKVWIGSQKGLGILNANHDSLLLFSESTGINCKLDYIEIRQILQFQNNKIWIGSATGLYLVDLNIRKVKHWGLDNLSNLHITSLLNFKDSLLFVGTENGYNILNLNTLEINDYYLFPELKDNPGSNVFLSNLMTSDSTLLVGIAAHGLHKFNINSKEFSEFNLPAVGTQNINFFDPQEEDVPSMTKDSYDNIWIGTAWNGLVRISPEPVLFKIFHKKPNSKTGLNDNHIWCFLSEKEKLWVGTESGINIYNFESHRIEIINTSSGLNSNRIRSLFKDSKGRHWVGTLDKGYNIINTNGSIVQYNTNSINSTSPNNTVWDFTEDSLGYIWLSTYNGLSRIDINTLEITVFKNDPNDSNSLSSNIIYNTTIDNRGRMWISTYRGLNRFIPHENRFIRYVHIKNDSNSLSTNKIFKVYDDNEGNLWIATVGGGLNKMDLKTGKIQWFTTHDGLPNNIIYSIIDDGLGFLWLSTNNGLCRFNKTTYVVNTYTVSDGLQSSEFNFGADLIDENQNIYMGGMKGFNVFNPKVINESSVDAPLTISKVNTLQGNSYYNIDFADTLTLDPDNNFFDIAYTQLNLKQSQKIVFRHKLLNYDPNWIVNPTGIAKASYSNVPAGTYYFTVQAANSNGAWTEEEYRLMVIVKQYWYKSLWFIISIIVLMLFLAIMLIRLRIQRIKHKVELVNQMLQLEKQALRLQMNPHFIFNTLNSIQSYILKNQAKESILYLSKFSKLMRSILNNSNESIIPLSDEIDMLNHYLELEQLRFNHCFDFNITKDDEIDSEFIGIPSMLLQPYIENAIIHGVAPLKSRQGKIDISFEIRNNSLYCIISDNGVGRSFHRNKKRGLHKPKGMLISKKRLQALNKDIDEAGPISIEDLVDEKNKANGTIIKLTIDFENLND